MSFLIDHLAAAGLLLGLWIAVAACLWAGLPRLAPATMLAATGGLGVALLVAGWLWMKNGDRSMAVAAALALTALVSGHAGWGWAQWHARRRRPAPPAASTAPGRNGRERRARAATPSAPPELRQATAPGAAPPVAAAAPASGPVAEASQRLTLGRYRLQREIGRGAMGAVYLGLDPQIGRPVAIKTMALAQEFDGADLAEARARFFREAETAGRLTHPDIVTIFDAGEDQDLAYIAMEYLHGHDLQRHTQPGALLPVVQVLRIGERVADALAYAHRQGVVHRDIKPANVMVDAASAGVKVTDFGIARITDSSRTRTGMVLGSPAYMSPEQMAGQRVDGRADLFSLGVMLFQLLTGRLPHQAESMAKLMYRIANEPAPDVRSLRPELPAALADTLARALLKPPDERQADGHQLAAELRAAAAACAGLDEAAPTAAVPAPAPSVQSDPFAATVKVSRTDPRHNSTD